ncbi:MAG: flagellar basal body-associated FliL family protein [Steroidobacteraceae bacterium]
MSDAKSAAAEPPKKKSSKKLLIIIASAVVVLAGGGAGAYFAFAGNTDAKQDAGKKPEHVAKAPGQFVTLDPPFVVNFGAGSSVRFLQIAVQLMTRDPHMVEFLQHNTPIIRNDLLLLFGNKQVEEVSTNEGKEALRAAALEAVRKIISSEGEKPEGLENVFFTSFVMQ